MTGIVEHVARAIFDGGVILPGETSQTATARAAIRATLEYARDNQSESMRQRATDAYLEECYDDPHSDPPSVTFRAMIDALLAELDGTESEGR